MTPVIALDEVAQSIRDNGGELRAGGTDITARQRSGQAVGPFVDLHLVSAMPYGIEWAADGSASIGALTTIAEIVADPRLRESYPALSATAGALATPQIRAAGTLGGNLLQRNRCWYYRNRHFSCFQTGGDGCPARDGLHLYSAVIDQGPCVAPHPSSIAMALLIYDAVADVHDRGRRPVADLYGDGSDPTRDHTLDVGDVLLSVGLPIPIPGNAPRITGRSAGSKLSGRWSKPSPGWRSKAPGSPQRASPWAGSRVRLYDWLRWRLGWSVLSCEVTLRRPCWPRRAPQSPTAVRFRRPATRSTCSATPCWRCWSAPRLCRHEVAAAGCRPVSY